MADVAPPRHPAPTPADANTYAPYAVLAVAALVVALLYAVVLAVLAVMAFRSGQPFIQPLLLVFPAAAVVLAFAARRQIQNSEGARAGMALVNAAWWVAVVAGLGYATYVVVYQLGVRQDAADSFRAWARNLNEVNLADPKDPAFFYVFEGTLDPEKHGKIKVGQADLLYRQNRMPYLAARQAFLVRLANRNRGELAFDVGGLENWEQDASGQKGNLAVRVKCPEGEFALTVPMLAKRVDGQWRWQVQLPPNPNLTSARVTRYGQFVSDLTVAGHQVVHDSFLAAAQVHFQNPALFHVYTRPGPGGYPARGWAEGQMAGRMSLLGGLATPHPEPRDYEAVIARHFEPADKGDPVREAEQRRQFVTAWRYGRLMPPGTAIQMNPDQQPILFRLPDALELKVPVEIQTPGGEMAGAAARGAVVLRCDDPAVLARLAELRQAAPSDPLADISPVPPAPNSVPWRLVRIESDMKAIAPERMTPGGPGGPGGAPGGPPGG